MTIDSFGIVQTYMSLGIQHILMGFDHLMFVAALMWLARGGTRLVWTVTAFTLAHSITLGVATLGFVHVPRSSVELAIALSIVFVANEIVQQRAGRKSLVAQRPWLLAFAFGLLHGFGFSGALVEAGLPVGATALALLSFNSGIEVGQLLFVGALLLATKLALVVGGRDDLFSQPTGGREEWSAVGTSKRS